MAVASSRSRNTAYLPCTASNVFIALSISITIITNSSSSMLCPLALHATIWSVMSATSLMSAASRSLMVSS